MNEKKSMAYYKWLSRQRMNKHAKKRAKHRKIRNWAKEHPPTEVIITDLFDTDEEKRGN